MMAGYLSLSISEPPPKSDAGVPDLPISKKKRIEWLRRGHDIHSTARYASMVYDGAVPARYQTECGPSASGAIKPPWPRYVDRPRSWYLFHV